MYYSIIFSRDKSFYSHLHKLPIWNFKQVEKTDDFRYLLKMKDYDNMIPISSKLYIKLSKLWEALDLEYLKEVGINKDYERYLKDKKKLMILELDYQITGDRFQKTLYDASKFSFDEKYKGSGEKVPFMEQVANLERYFKFRLDVKKLNCLQYFTYDKVMRKEIEDLKRKTFAKNG